MHAEKVFLCLSHNFKMSRKKDFFSSNDPLGFSDIFSKFLQRSFIWNCFYFLFIFSFFFYFYLLIYLFILFYGAKCMIQEFLLLEEKLKTNRISKGKYFTSFNKIKICQLLKIFLYIYSYRKNSNIKAKR